MVKVYHHNLKNWSNWLSHQPLGRQLLNRTQKNLADSNVLQRNLQKVALIGVPSQAELCSDLSIEQRLILLPESISPKLADFGKPVSNGFLTELVTDWSELPLQTASMELCVLPHSLEFAAYPRKLFQEACRVIRPEGLIVIMGWNPYGIWSWSAFQNCHPKPSHSLSAQTLKNWLSLADFQIESHTSFLFDLPVPMSEASVGAKFFEKILSLACPRWGSVYCLIARAKVIPLSPIRVQWKQGFSRSSIPATYRS